ncbi:ComEC/Rec2 family competence protein [Brevibacterium samyangense]|uniref:ComEC/Rec2 family competence protein n=1 Tax=Brevibacterium samyangense TaxID=366888 RepID=A0ABN2THC0_9MICO
MLRHSATGRLLIAVALLWAAVGTGLPSGVVFTAALVLTAPALLFFDRSRGEFARWAWSTLVFAGIGLLLAGLGSARVEGASAEFTGEVTVVSDPVLGAGGTWSATVLGRHGPLTVHAHEELPPAGTRVLVDVTTERSAARVRGFLDSDPEVLAAPAVPWTVRADLRAFLAEAVGASAEGAPARGLVPGLVIGDTRAVPAALEEDMQTVSLSHLVAVSGSNIAIVSVAVLWAVRFLTPRRGVATACAVAVTLGYVFVVGPEPSVVRAAAMGLLGALVLVRGSGTPGLAVLATAVGVVLTLSPDLAVTPGFQLSVAATAALVLLGVPACEALVRKQVPYPIAAALVVPVCAQIGVTPVLLTIGGTLSVWSVPANVLVAPVVAPATVLGIVVLALGMCAGPAGAPAVPGVHVLAELLGHLPVACAWWIVRTATVAADLPAAVWPWASGPLGVLCASAACAGLVLGVLVDLRWARVLGAGLLVLAQVVGTLVPVVVRPRLGEWEVLVCDVGQGSATVVALGDGDVLLIDAGPAEEPLRACLDTAGARRVHLLVSHFDSDHIRGYPGATRGRDVVTLHIGPGTLVDPVARDLVGAVAPLAPTVVSAGDRYAFGDVTVEYLWPSAERAASLEDPNGNSLVARVTTGSGLVLLAPGDVGEAEQGALAAELRNDPAETDVLLAAHHGSGDLDPEFYTAAGAPLGVVSVGADNRYGHPHPDALDAFGQAAVLRTDECGSIAVALRDGLIAARGTAAVPGACEAIVPR